MTEVDGEGQAENRARAADLVVPVRDAALGPSVSTLLDTRVSSLHGSMMKAFAESGLERSTAMLGAQALRSFESAFTPALLAQFRAATRRRCASRCAATTSSASSRGPWSLCRHWWVVVKLVITVLATVVLLLCTGTLRLLGDAARSPSPADDLALLPSGSPVLHAAAAVAVLLGAAVLSVYKPRGRTAYGWRRRQVPASRAGANGPLTRARPVGSLVLRPRPQQALDTHTPRGYLDGTAHQEAVMDHSSHATPQDGKALTRLAVSATLHCLTGCAIGEVLGMVIGTALGWSDLQTVALAVGLAFFFGYALTIRPILKSGLALSAAIPVALAADTLSITVMEIVDNAIMLAIPGAMEAGLASPLFWGSLAVALAIAFVVTVPVNRWLIGRGKGHAVVHQFHGGAQADATQISSTQGHDAHDAHATSQAHTQH